MYMRHRDRAVALLVRVAQELAHAQPVLQRLGRARVRVRVRVRVKGEG